MSVSLSTKNNVSFLKEKLVWLSTQTITQHFSRQHSLVHSRRALCRLPISSHRILRRNILHCWRLIQNYFILLHKNILEWKGHFFFKLQVCSSMHNDRCHSLVSLSWSVIKGQLFCLSQPLYYQCKYQQSRKGKKLLLLLSEWVGPHRPLKGSGSSEQFRNHRSDLPSPKFTYQQVPEGNSSWYAGAGLGNFLVILLTERGWPQKPWSINWGTQTRVHKDSLRLIPFRSTKGQMPLLFLKVHYSFHITSDSFFIKETVPVSE